MVIKIITSGKRKRAVARAILEEGEGKVTINSRDYRTLNIFDRLKIDEPLRIAENVLGKPKFNVSISVRGGGEKGQIDASRVALSKAIVKFSKSEELERAYLDYDRNLLVADVRRKETYKPGDSKARRKRQKSYR
jgi:small subunit ribosomal protein S9